MRPAAESIEENVLKLPLYLFHHIHGIPSSYTELCKWVYNCKYPLRWKLLWCHCETFTATTLSWPCKEVPWTSSTSPSTCYASPSSVFPSGHPVLHTNTGSGKHFRLVDIDQRVLWGETLDCTIIPLSLEFFHKIVLSIVEFLLAYYKLTCCFLGCIHGCTLWGPGPRLSSFKVTTNSPIRLWLPLQFQS